MPAVALLAALQLRLECAALHRKVSMEASAHDATEPTIPPARKPLGLIAAFVLVAGAAIAAGVYARWLDEQRQRLQLQLSQDERRILDLREALTCSEVAVQEKQAALATRDVALAEATQPDLPVRVSFRPAWMGQGMVATFRNEATEPISLMVEVRDPQVHRSKSFAFDINPGASADIGHAQGWLVSSGQSLRVAATGYKPVTAFAP
jgi:hypothetical protein